MTEQAKPSPVDLALELRASHDRLQTLVARGKIKDAVLRERECVISMSLCWRAADEIDRLKIMNVELVGALEKIAAEKITPGPGHAYEIHGRIEVAKFARAVLEKHKVEPSSCYVHGDHDGERCPKCAEALEGG